MMFAVIYRFYLQPHQEEQYRKCWDKLTDYFVEERSAIGSCLHKSDDGLWVAYSRWPDKATRDASWPGDDAPSDVLPNEIKDIIKTMQKFKEENKQLEKFDEICMEVLNDKLHLSGNS